MSAEHRSGQMIIGIGSLPRPHPKCEDQLEINQSSKDRNPASNVFSLKTETKENKRKDRATPSLCPTSHWREVTSLLPKARPPSMALYQSPPQPPSISFLHLQPHHIAFLSSNILDSFGIHCAMKDFFLVIRCCKSASLSRIN